jgi:uncharacterized low-complexity protein
MNIARALTVAAAAVAIPPDRLRATARAVAGRQRAKAMPSARGKSARAKAAAQDAPLAATDAGEAARRSANRTALQASRALLARTIDMLT